MAETTSPLEQTAAFLVKPHTPLELHDFLAARIATLVRSNKLARPLPAHIESNMEGVELSGRYHHPRTEIDVLKTKIGGRGIATLTFARPQAEIRGFFTSTHVERSGQKPQLLPARSYEPYTPAGHLAPALDAIAPILHAIESLERPHPSGLSIDEWSVALGGLMRQKAEELDLVPQSV